MTPEQKARIEIDRKLTASGWLLQDKKEFNPAAALGVAVREFNTDSGPVDYLLFVGRKPVCVVEAKKAEEGQNMTVHEAQSKRYGASGIKWTVSGQAIRFAYEATDRITRFTDYADEKARSRELFSFHRPETMHEWMVDDSTIRNRMKVVPTFEDAQKRFRDCQIKAICGLERSFAENRPRALIQMATGNKARFVIVDAVGVTKSLKTESRPLERKPGVSLKDLMMGVVMGARDEDTLTTLAGRLTKLDKELTPTEQKKFTEISNGLTISDAAKALLNAFDEDYIAQSGKTQEELAEAAALPFYEPKLRDFVLDARKAHDQIIDNINLDTVNVAAWDGDYEKKSETEIATFRQFIEDNKDEITAMTILYNGTWKTRPLTLQMIQEVYDAMQKQNLSTERLWNAYSYTQKDIVKTKSPVSKLIDIVSLLRFELGITTELAPYSDTVNYNFMRWTMAKNAGHVHFTDEQMNWLRMVKDFIANSMAITPDDLDLAPFNRHGGLGKFYSLFGDGYEALLDEMNIALAA
ncbi:MAG: hypothetical protein FWF87_07400 [Synergistaceae bacterium]|nr:hypothetical protein [Synergistaceae bacterium]